MSTGKNDNKKTSSLYTVIYIAAVLVLIGCLAFLIWDSVKKDEEFEQRVQKVAQGETEYVLAERTRETETEEMTEPRPETESETAGTAAPGTPQAGTIAGAQSDSGAETQPGGATAVTGNLQASVLVLNGTRRAGVAAYWQSVLRTDGYSNVSMATYRPEASDHTVIYYNGETFLNTATALQAYFPGSEIVYGTPAEGIEPTEGSPIPDEIEIYIVVGLQDAKAEETEGQTSPEGQVAGQQQASPEGQQTPSESQVTGQQVSPGGQAEGQQTPSESQVTGQQVSPGGQTTGQQQVPSGGQTTEPQRPPGTLT